MTTGKVVLLVGGVGLGGLLLYELFKPGSTLLKPATATSISAQTGSLLSGLVSAVAGAVSNSGSKSGAAPFGSAALGQAATPVSAYGADGNVVATYSSSGAAANYEYADTHPGTALPAGVYGPAIPTNNNVSAGDDGLLAPDYA